VVGDPGRVQEGARVAGDPARMTVSGGRLNLSRAACDAQAY